MPVPIVAELAGVPARPADLPAVDDEPAADAARTAVQVDDVIHPARRSEQMLGDDAHAGVIADHCGQARRICDQIAQRDISPQQVRGVADEAVGSANESGTAIPTPAMVCPASSPVRHASS